MERFPLHEFDWSLAENDQDPKRLAEFYNEEEALKELNKHENTARKMEGCSYPFWTFDCYWVVEVEVENEDSDEDEEDWNCCSYWYAPWANPEWYKDPWLFNGDYSYYYDDEDEEDED